MQRELTLTNKESQTIVISVSEDKTVVILEINNEQFWMDKSESEAFAEELNYYTESLI